MQTNDLRRSLSAVLPRPPRIAAVAALVGLLAVPLIVRAGTDLVPANPAYQRFLTQYGANSASMYYGVGGAFLPSASGLAQHATVSGLSPTAGEVSRFAALKTKYGEVPFKASQTFTVGRLAKGIGAIAGGPLGVGLLALEFTADWLSDASLSVSDGGVGYLQSDGGCGGYSVTHTDFVDSGWTHKFEVVNYAGQCYETEFVKTATTAWQVNQRWLRGAPGTPVDVLTPLDQAGVESALLASSRTPSEIEKILSETIKYPEIQPDPVDWVRIDPVTPSGDIKSPTKTDKSTTTNPDGSKVEQTKNCWVKGTVQLGASLKLSEVCNTDTVTKSPSGTVTGTTTATTDSEISDAATPKEEEPGFCETLVGKLVCADMDTPDTQIPKTTKDVTFTPENLGFGDGQCPPPYTWTDHAGSHAIDLAPYCDKLTTVVRPLVILFAMLAAFFIVAPGKSEGGA